MSDEAMQRSKCALMDADAEVLREPWVDLREAQVRHVARAIRDAMRDGATDAQIEMLRERRERGDAAWRRMQREAL